MNTLSEYSAFNPFIKSGLTVFKLVFAAVLACVFSLAGTAWTTAPGNFGAFGCSIASAQEYSGDLTLNKDAFSFDSTETRQLKPSFVSGKEVINLSPEEVRSMMVWSSSDEAVATVNDSGTVTAISRGTAIITCALKDNPSRSVSCTATVTGNRFVVTSIGAFQSEHPYDLDSNDTWVYSNPFASSILITFDQRTSVEDGFDFIEIYGADDVLIGRYTAAILASAQVEIPGNSVAIRLLSDKSFMDWGFAITEVKPIIDDGWYEYEGNVYFFRDGDLQKGIVDDGGVLYHFDEATGAYIEQISSLEPASAAEDSSEGAPKETSPASETSDSSGSGLIDVPDTIGLYYEDAIAILEGLGFSVEPIWDFDNFFMTSSGTVIGTSYGYSAQLPYGSYLQLNVSLGPNMKEVLDVCGMNRDLALNALIAQGFNVSFATGIPTYTIELIDTIASQDPAAGTSAVAGTTVTLTPYYDANAKG